jgi:hypothetical protein
MDQYWARLRNTYQSLEESSTVSDRWKTAYARLNGFEDQEPVIAPTFSPSATTPQQFIVQYSEAIGHLAATKSPRLVLPKNFMENWRKAEDQTKKG